MLDNEPFYFSLIKKYVALFGATFSDLYIDRLLPADSTEDQRIKVPISYAPKDKLLARVDADPDLKRPFSALFPRIGFDLVSMTYDNSRKQATVNYNAHRDPNDPEIMLKQYVGTPYNLYFNLYIAAKNAEDAAKILEQILPFFDPAYTSSVVLIEEMNIRHDIPIILNPTITKEDHYDGDFEVRKTLIWTLQFTMKAYLYGPIKRPGLIKFVAANLYDATLYDPIKNAVGQKTVDEIVNAQVTLTANGEPTTDYRLSIPYQQIHLTDDYGFATWIENVTTKWKATENG